MALGIGILVGISMGDSTLVFNQIAVIEELEGKIHSYRQKTEEIASHMNELQYELERWNIINERYLQPLIKDSLNDFSVTLIAGDDYPADLLKFLEKSGCSYRVFYLTAPEQWTNNLIDSSMFRAEEVENFPVFSYGEILWEAIRYQEDREEDEILATLQDHGLLDIKYYSPKTSFSQNSKTAPLESSVFLLTGDISFVSSVLKEGIRQREEDYTWIAIYKGFVTENSKSLQLPGNWAVINNGDTFFSRVELWEIMKQLATVD